VYSPGKGLMPDFIVGTDTATPYPSPGYMGDGNNMEGYFYWNGCRNPWRLGTDYVLSGDTRFATVCGRLMDFFQSASGGNAASISCGYKLDGTVLGAFADPSFIGPAAVGAMVDGRFQGLLDSAWSWNAAHLQTGYYAAEIQLLSMVVASGNWWTPGTGTPSGTGSTSTSNTTTTVVGTNVLVNGDFSNGLTGWTNWGNSVAASGAVQVGTAAGGIAQDIGTKLTAGTKYQLTGRALITLAAEGIFVGVKLMDAAGNVLLNQSQLVSSLTMASLSVSFTAPQGAASGVVFVWKNANSALGYVDDLSLVAVA
jgi:hypothetical protein